MLYSTFFVYFSQRVICVPTTNIYIFVALSFDNTKFLSCFFDWHKTRRLNPFTRKKTYAVLQIVQSIQNTKYGNTKRVYYSAHGLLLRDTVTRHWGLCQTFFFFLFDKLSNVGKGQRYLRIAFSEFWVVSRMENGKVEHNHLTLNESTRADNKADK